MTAAPRARWPQSQTRRCACALPPPSKPLPRPTVRLGPGSRPGRRLTCPTHPPPPHGSGLQQRPRRLRPPAAEMKQRDPAPHPLASATEIVAPDICRRRGTCHRAARSPVRPGRGVERGRTYAEESRRPRSRAARRAPYTRARPRLGQSRERPGGPAGTGFFTSGRPRDTVAFLPHPPEVPKPTGERAAESHGR